MADTGPPEVLHVITRLAKGGSERRLFDVLGAVNARHVVMVGAESDEAAVRSLSSDVEVLRCEHLVRSLDPVNDVRALARMAALVRARRLRVIHTHQSKAGLLGRVASCARRGTTVFHSASMASFGPGYGFVESSVFALAERVSAPLVDRYAVVGADLARRLRANGVAARRLTTIRSSLELEAFLPAGPQERSGLRGRLGVPDDRPVVVFVGSLDERKGGARLPSLLREAMAADSGAPVAMSVLVAGDGPLRERLSRELEAVPGLAVRMLGHVIDVASVMRAADLLVLPSSAEGLPQVVVQAASAGLPVVAYDVDGVREMADLGATVAVVPLGDEAAFSSAIRSGAEASRDSDPADVRSRLAPDVLDQWRPSTVAEQYRELYAPVLEARGGR